MVDLSLRSNFDCDRAELWLSVQERTSNKRISAQNSAVFVCEIHNEFNGAKLSGGPGSKGFWQATSIGAHALLELIEPDLSRYLN